MVRLTYAGVAGWSAGGSSGVCPIPDMTTDDEHVQQDPEASETERSLQLSPPARHEPFADILILHTSMQARSELPRRDGSVSNQLEKEPSDVTILPQP